MEAMRVSTPGGGQSLVFRDLSECDEEELGPRDFFYFVVDGVLNGFFNLNLPDLDLVSRLREEG